MQLTDKQYQIILDLFNEMPNVFRQLPMDIKHAFFERLYAS